MSSIEVLWGIGLGVSAAAALFDVRTRHIPNQVVAVGLVLALGVALAGGLIERPGWESLVPLLKGLLGVVACAALPLLLWLRGAFGGGDVKLLGVIGAAFGPFHGFQISLWSFVAAAAFALVSKLFGGRGLHVDEPLATKHASSTTSTRPSGEGDSHQGASQAERGERGSEDFYLVFAPPLFLAVALYCVLHWPSR